MYHLALAAHAYNDPIRLPDENGVTPDLPDIDGFENSPHAPQCTVPDDTDDGTCLLSLLRSRDPLGDVIIRGSFNEDNLLAFSELLELESADIGDISQLFSNGFPLHRALLKSHCGLSSLINEQDQINFFNSNSSSDNVDTAQPSDPLRDHVYSILKEVYGGPCHRAATRAHLLHLLNTGQDTDGIIKCGDATFKVHQFMLSHRSDFFKAAFAHSRATAKSFNGQIMIEMPTDYIRTPGLFAKLLQYCYTLHITELDALLSNPDSLIEVAYCGEMLMLPELKTSSLAIVCQGIDSTNAPSLLHVAEQLDFDPMRRCCIGHMVKHLAEVAKRAPNFTQFVGAKEYEWLKRLGEASQSNPIACGAIFTDEREYIAMLSETLDAQRIQYCDAMARQTEELRDFEKQVSFAQQAEARAMEHHTQDSVFHDMAKRLSSEVEQRRARLELVDNNLKNQARHIEFVQGFLERAALASAQASYSTLPAAPTPPISSSSSLCAAEGEEDRAGEFIPTYEWQVIKENQAIPAGLDISLNISAGFGGSQSQRDGHARRARIPPVWRLKLWVEYFGDVSTTVMLDDENGDNEEGCSASSSNTSTAAVENKKNKYHRQDVRRDDTIGAMESAIAASENVDVNCVRVMFYDEVTKSDFMLDSNITFEPYLFIHQKYMKAFISDDFSRYGTLQLHMDQLVPTPPPVASALGEAAMP